MVWKRVGHPRLPLPLLTPGRGDSPISPGSRREGLAHARATCWSPECAARYEALLGGGEKCWGTRVRFPKRTSARSPSPAEDKSPSDLPRELYHAQHPRNRNHPRLARHMGLPWAC
jgi:hypothetical protein